MMFDCILKIVDNCRHQNAEYLLYNTIHDGSQRFNYNFQLNREPRTSNVMIGQSSRDDLWLRFAAVKLELNVFNCGKFALSLNAFLDKRIILTLKD